MAIHDATWMGFEIMVFIYFSHNNNHVPGETTGT